MQIREKENPLNATVNTETNLKYRYYVNSLANNRNRYRDEFDGDATHGQPISNSSFVDP